MDHLRCPWCLQVDRVEKVSGVYARGTSETKAEQVGVGVDVDDMDDPFLFVGASDGVQSTLLSQRLAPPTDLGWLGGAVCFVVLFWIIGAIVSNATSQWPAALQVALLVLLAGSLLFVVVSAAISNHSDVLQKYGVWNSQYYCYRCDGVFSPN